MELHQESRTATQIFISSLIASVISTIATNPIEVAKLKMQYAPISCPKYPHQTFRQLIRCNCVGFVPRDAFKGLSIVIPQTIISNAIFIQLYQMQRKLYLQYLGPTNATICSSLLSRLIVSTIINPMEAFRVRLVNSTKKNKIIGRHGGLKITLVRDLTFSALYWSLVQSIRNNYTGKQYRNSSNQGKLTANAIAGVLAGGLVAAVTTPLDTIKTRKQSGVPSGGTILSQIQSIYYKEGLTGLFSGIHFRMAKSGLHSALYLIFYESILGKLTDP